MHSHLNSRTSLAPSVLLALISLLCSSSSSGVVYVNVYFDGTFISFYALEGINMLTDLWMGVSSAIAI